MFGNKGTKTKEQKELEKLIAEHRELCKVARQKIAEYDTLNRELSMLIAECKMRMKEADMCGMVKENAGM